MKKFGPSSLSVYSLDEEENGVSMKHFYRCPYILRLAIGSYFHTYVLFVFSRISKFNASITTLSGCIKEATSGIVDDLKSPAGLWNSIYF